MFKKIKTNKRYREQRDLQGHDKQVSSHPTSGQTQFVRDGDIHLAIIVHEYYGKKD